jgi:hypothetical protein
MKPLPRGSALDEPAQRLGLGHHAESKPAWHADGLQRGAPNSPR